MNRNQLYIALMSLYFFSGCSVGHSFLDLLIGKEGGRRKVIADSVFTHGKTYNENKTAGGIAGLPSTREESSDEANKRLGLLGRIDLQGGDLVRFLFGTPREQASTPATSTTGVVVAIEVNSILDPSLYEKSILNKISYEQKIKYYLHPGDPTVSENDLYFKEYINYVNKIFDSDKYEQVSKESADIIILVSYGVGDPKLKSYTRDIFGMKEGEVTGFTSNTQRGRVKTTVVKENNSFGVVGQEEVEYEESKRYLILEGVVGENFNKNQTTISLWKTMITSVGKSDDLRFIMPFLVVGASDYIGKDTRRKINFDIDGSDFRIQELIK